MFIYLFQQHRHRKQSLSPEVFLQLSSLQALLAPADGGHEEGRQSERVLRPPGCYRAPARPLASALPGRGREVRRLLACLADRCPIFVTAWKVSGRGSHRAMAGEGRGKGEGDSPAPTAAHPQQQALRAGYQRGLHVQKHIHQLHFFCIFFAIRTSCHRCVAPSPLHRPVVDAGGHSGEHHDSGAVQ